ncbi:MAG: fibronectin type III domain-containing protein, partial [Chloroflexi bacterium]|nr:fibronectin type III domain-containing protein [Chloroflexota bacterium]
MKGHPPAAPTGLSSSNVAHNTATISWTAPARGAVTSYHVLRATDGGALTRIDTITGTSHVDDTISAQTEYIYAVTATGPDGDGAQSTSITVTTLAEPTPPSAPTSLSAQAQDGSVNLSWTAPTGDDVTG